MRRVRIILAIGNLIAALCWTVAGFAMIVAGFVQAVQHQPMLYPSETVALHGIKMMAMMIPFFFIGVEMIAKEDDDDR